MLSRRSILAAAAAVPAAAAGAAPVRLRFSAYLAPVSHTITSIVKPWIAGIEEEAGGRLGFELFAGGALGRSPYAQFDLLRAGVAEVAFVQPNYTAGQFKQLQVLEVPLLTRNSVEASVLAWMLVERGLVKGFEDVHVLGLWTAEPGNLFTRVPVKSFADLKNLKIRSAGGRIHRPAGGHRRGHAPGRRLRGNAPPHHRRHGARASGGEHVPDLPRLDPHHQRALRRGVVRAGDE
jgi:TRAP-type C4-dicarboxylate transport system substrate-binding protein